MVSWLILSQACDVIGAVPQCLLPLWFAQVWKQEIIVARSAVCSLFSSAVADRNEALKLDPLADLDLTPCHTLLEVPIVTDSTHQIR